MVSKSYEGKPNELIEAFGMGVESIKNAIKRILNRKKLKSNFIFNFLYFYIFKTVFDIITIGSATRDAFLKSDDFVIVKGKEFITGRAECLPLGAKIEVKNIVFTTGGGATNSAVSFARQGLKTSCVTRVGRDVSGEEVIKGLKREVIATFLVINDSELATGYSIILIAKKGDRSVLVFRGASQKFNEKEIKWTELKNTNWLYITSLAGNIKFLKKIVDFADKNNIKIAINPGSCELKFGFKLLKPILNKVNLLLLNREEASYLTKLPYEEEKEIFRNLCGIAKDLVIMTEGPKGVLVCDGRNIWRAGTYKEKLIADRTGAGDSFGSGFVSGFMKTGDMEYAIKLGSANATSVVEHIGAKEGILRKGWEKDKRWRKLDIKRIRL